MGRLTPGSPQRRKNFGLIFRDCIKLFDKKF